MLESTRLVSDGGIETEFINNDHFDEAMDVSQSSDVVSSPEQNNSEGSTKQHFTNRSADNESEDSFLSEAVSVPSVSNSNLLGSTKRSPEVSKDNNMNEKGKFFDDAFSADSEDNESIDTQKSFVEHETQGHVSLLSTPHILTTDKNRKASSTAKVNVTKAHILNDTSNDDESRSYGHSIPLVGGYDPQHFADLDVSPSIKELFTYIERFQPQNIQLETPLRCFIPDYMPAIGEVDPFIKVPRPDGNPDGLGLTVLDEPATNQSDAAVLELQLRAISKKRHRSDVLVRSIDNADKCPHEIERWITSVEELHKSKSSPEVRFTHTMPNMEELMAPWPEEYETASKNGVIKVPDPNLDMSLEEYAKILCCIADIPVHEGCLVQSISMLFSLYIELQQKQHF